MEYNELFEYKDGKLYNKIRRGTRALKGSIAGWLSQDDGYYRVNVKINNIKRQRLVHRVIWEMFNSAPSDSLVIDHVNNDKGDNRIENLQLVTQAENVANYFKDHKHWRHQ